MKILIVEDDSFYAQYVAELLQDRNVETTQVQSAEEALAADITNYDAAVMDVMLPNDPEVSGSPTRKAGEASIRVWLLPDAYCRKSKI